MNTLDMTNLFKDKRAAMFIAHPSHELRVYGWVNEARPLTFILTDGSGRSGEPRIDWTTRLLDKAGIERGGIYGRLSDLDVYASILRRDYGIFIDLTDELAEALISEEIDYIAGDAVEGVNVSHETCRLMIGAAVEKAKRMSGRSIANYDFIVVGSPSECPEELKSGAIRLCLDDETLNNKIEAARHYHPKLAADVNAALHGDLFRGAKRFTEPALAAEASAKLGDMAILDKYPELKTKIAAMLEGVKLESFSEEILRPADNRAGCSGMPSDPAFYEIYGENLVSAGKYHEVIRYREHMMPLADALWHHIG